MSAIQYDEREVIGGSVDRWMGGSVDRWIGGSEQVYQGVHVARWWCAHSAGFGLYFYLSAELIMSSGMHTYLSSMIFPPPRVAPPTS